MRLRDAVNGRKVLVTGADGFIGSHLTEALVEAGAKVTALVCYNSFNSWGWIDDFPSSRRDALRVVLGDVRDPSMMRTLCEGQEWVFHLAALIGIPYSYQAPDSYLETNIRGTLNVLQAARQSAVERVLVTSTSEVYGTARYIPIDEAHPLQAQSPYAASKIGADRMAESFHRSFGLPVTIVRPFNTYGPRQSSRAIIPTIINQLLAGQRKIKLGNLSPTRDLNFVTDTVAGFLAIAASEQTIGEEINIATGEEISMGLLAEMLVEMISPGAEIVTDAARERPSGSEVERLLGCSKRLRTLTSWCPSVSLHDGLLKTTEWFRERNGEKDHAKAAIYTV